MRSLWQRQQYEWQKDHIKGDMRAHHRARFGSFQSATRCNRANEQPETHLPTSPAHQFFAA
jgi:hypothetical protein